MIHVRSDVYFARVNILGVYLWNIGLVLGPNQLYSRLNWAKLVLLLLVFIDLLLLDRGAFTFLEDRFCTKQYCGSMLGTSTRIC